MNKRLVTIIIVVLLGVSGFLLLFHYHSDTSSLHTTLSPTISSIVSLQPTITSGTLPFPLQIPSGFSISVFAQDLGNARDLEITPGGTILVSVPNTNSVLALFDINNTGIAEQRTALRGENVVHGLAFHKNKLYVAEKNSVLRYSWNETSKTATFEKKLLTLPGDTDHTYRTIIFGPDTKMYISIGSNCNVCYESNPWVGSVIQANEDGTDPVIFSKGQRNAPFMAINPLTSELWATGMGRDNLGDSTPPDEINILKMGGDYGWPICYGNKVHDTSFDTKKYIQDPCKNTVSPIYEIAAHSAPLGLAFVPEVFNPEWKGDLLVAYHGSWNRSTKIGYKVVHLTVRGNSIVKEDDFITGFFDGSTVFARPVDILFDTTGKMYISDDKSGYIFVVKKR